MKFQVSADKRFILMAYNIHHVSNMSRKTPRRSGLISTLPVRENGFFIASTDYLLYVPLQHKKFYIIVEASLSIVFNKCAVQAILPV